jgi:hypothetical protein
MRNTLIKAVLIFGILITLSACTTNYIQPTSIIKDPNHTEIASIRRHFHESYMVMYNPDTCKKIGDACSFFISHAYAHYRLNHSLLRPKYYPTLSENQADCYVAKYANQNVLNAVIDLLEDENRDPSLKIHGDALLRAENIRNCAIEAGNWTKS